MASSRPPKVVAVIPARRGSSRFPGKPLPPISGGPMVEHVRLRAGHVREPGRCLRGDL